MTLTPHDHLAIDPRDAAIEFARFRFDEEALDAAMKQVMSAPDAIDRIRAVLAMAPPQDLITVGHWAISGNRTIDLGRLVERIVVHAFCQMPSVTDTADRIYPHVAAQRRDETSNQQVTQVEFSA